MAQRHSLHHQMVTTGEILDEQIEGRCGCPFFDVAVDLETRERRAIKEQLFYCDRVLPSE